jgi:lysophosphatidate acyltransferase
MNEVVPVSPAFRPSSKVRAVFATTAIFSVMIVVTAVYVLVCLLLLWSRRYRIYSGNLYGKIIGRTVMFFTGITALFSNRDRISGGSPAIFVCNHSATIDMWVSMWACPYGGCGTAKREIVKIPIFGLAYLLSGHLLIDRSNRERAIASMAKVTELVQKHGLSLWVWPEGTRSRSGRLLPFKKGFAHLAIATGLPIVPLVFHNADQLWPGGSLRPASGQLQIEVLPDIDTSAWTTEGVDEHCKEIHGVFQAALGERQKALPEPAV